MHFSIVGFSRLRLRRNLAGFTLLELIITLTILGLLVSMGMPAYMEMVRNTQIRNAAESIHAGIQLARIEALKRNTNVSFWLVSLTNPKVMNETCALGTTSPSWIVSLDDPSGKCGTAPSTTTAPRIVQSHAAGDGSSNVALTVNSGNSLTFNGLGQTVGNSMTQIKVISSQSETNFRRLRIEISASGSTRVCDIDIQASDDPRKCKD